jgi:cytochrome P450
VWILKYLSDYPAVQSKLREEIQNVLSQAARKNRLPTASEISASLRQSPNLKAVIEEMLRLRQAMIIPRDATRDTELLGCTIAEGTSVLLVCQSPDFATLRNVDGKPVDSHLKYPGEGANDMRTFDPERWITRKKNGTTEFDGTTYPQLAFGGGVRACWGRKVAEHEMQIVTTLLVWSFDFLELPDLLATHEATYDITYRAVKGYVKVRSRDM